MRQLQERWQFSGRLRLKRTSGGIQRAMDYLFPVVFLVLVPAGFGITLLGVVGLVRTKGAYARALRIQGTIVRMELASSFGGSFESNTPGNLLALGIRTLQTEVAWQSPELIAFFHHEGFALAPRLCLDLDLARTRRS